MVGENKLAMDDSMFNEIASFANLWAASKKAQRGKRGRRDVCEFNFRLENNLHQLKEELLDGSYKFGGYKSFTITEPKKRMISAAPYRDRVVHHAVCNLIFPLIEEIMSPNSYSNRKGMGTHKAIYAYQKMARKYPYALKCDVKKFFPSIDHALLKQMLTSIIPCERTIQFISGIIDNSNEQEPSLDYYEGDNPLIHLERRKGLPLGNLTSQHFGNLFLSELDRFVVETLGVGGYVRYVDDFIILGPDAKTLGIWKNAISEFLATMRLSLHPKKSQIYLTSNGVPFLGQLVFPKYRRICSSNVKRFKARLKHQLHELKCGHTTQDDVVASLNSWTGHAGHCASNALRQSIANKLEEKGFPSEKLRVLRGGSWNNNSDNCRVAYRNNNDPSNRNNNVGLRLASV